MHDKIFTAKELSERWGCTKTHIYNMVRDKKLKAFKVGSLVRFRGEEVERIEGNQGVPAGDKR